jgi:hypothetical protein
MKVKELIESLKRFDGNANVQIRVDETIEVDDNFYVRAVTDPVVDESTGKVKNVDRVLLVTTQQWHK